MVTIEEKKYRLKLQKIRRKGEQRLRKEELTKEKMKYRKKIKLPPTSKIYFGLILLFSISVAIFSMMAMWHFGDLSALYGLIGATITPAIGYISYNIKATKENIQKYPDVQAVSFDAFNNLNYSEEKTNETINGTTNESPKG